MTTPLPTNLDATYDDVPADPSVKLHQQWHDSLHGRFNGALGHKPLGHYRNGLGAGSPVSQTLGRQFTSPVWLGGPVDAVSVNTGGASGASIKVLLYADSNGYPGALLHDSGQIDCSTSGVKTQTVSWDITPGAYWVSTLTLGAACVFTSLSIPAMPFQTSSGDPQSAGVACHFTAAATAADPHPAMNVIAGVNGSFPAVTLRAAA